MAQRPIEMDKAKAKMMTKKSSARCVDRGLGDVIGSGFSFLFLFLFLFLFEFVFKFLYPFLQKTLLPSPSA